MLKKTKEKKLNFTIFLIKIIYITIKFKIAKLKLIVYAFFSH